jgi:hypothetical protein
MRLTTWVRLCIVVLVGFGLGAFQGTAAAQESDTFVIIRAVDCEEAPEPGTPPLSEGTPAGCVEADGVTFTISDLEDTVLGTCTTDVTGSCEMIVPVAEGTEVVIEEDESTVTPGYAPINNPLTGPLRTFESIAEIQFFNIPEDEDVDELPDTGVGVTAPSAPGTWMPVLLAGALLLTLAGSRLRSQRNG